MAEEQAQQKEEKHKKKSAPKKAVAAKPSQPSKESAKYFFASGKRKAAVARGKIWPGFGRVMINSRLLDSFPNFQKLMISEPLLLAGEGAGKYNFDISVSGGGVYGQAEAVRQVIARGLVHFNKGLRKGFQDYDRSLLVADVRRNEPHKPSRSSAGPRRHKQRSKR